MIILSLNSRSFFFLLCAINNKIKLKKNNSTDSANSLFSKTKPPTIFFPNHNLYQILHQPYNYKTKSKIKYISLSSTLPSLSKFLEFTKSTLNWYQILQSLAVIDKNLHCALKIDY